MNFSSKYVALVMAAALLSPAVVLAEELSGTVSASSEIRAAGSADVVLSAEGVVAPRDAASGLPTGKRQHQPLILSTQANTEAGAEASGTRPLPTQVERREEIMDKRAEVRDAALDRRDAARETLTERRMEIAKRFIAQQVGRMGAMIDRLEKIADRLGSRIEKLSGMGVDTAKSTELLGSARLKLADAENALLSAKASAELVLAGSSATGTERETGKALVREALSDARDAVRAAHKALVDAVVSLNASTNTMGGGATTTSSTTVNTQQ